MKSLSSRRLYAVSASIILSLAAADSASAQTTYYWDGNGATTGAGATALDNGTWGGATASAFWSTSSAGTSATTTTGPGTADTAVFTAYDGTAADSPTGAYTVTLGAAQSVAGVVIGSTASTGNDGTLTLALSGANTLTIGAGGITMNGSSGDPTIGASTGTGTLVLGADQTWTINNSHVIRFNSNIVGTAAAGATRTLTLGYVNQYTNTLYGVIADGTAGGNLALTLNNVNSGGTATGGGTWQIVGTTNTYSGQTTIDQGILEFNSINTVGGGASSLGSVTTVANGTINIGLGTKTGTLEYDGGTNSVSDRVINLAGTTGGATITNIGAGTLSLSGGATSSGGTNTLTFRGTNTGTNTFSGLINDASGTGAGTISVAKLDAGSWNLSNNNTFGGTLTSSAGTLIMNGSNTFNGVVTVSGGAVTMNGSDSFFGGGSGNSLVVSGGTLVLGGANSGFGNYSVTGGVLTLNSNNDGVGTLSVSGGGTVAMGVNGTLASANISLNNGFLLLGGSGNVGSGNAITIGTSGGGIGVTYTPTSFPTFTDNSGTTGGVFGIGYVGTGGIGSVPNITNLFGSTSYWSLGAFTGINGTYTGTSLPVGAGNTYRLGGGGGQLTIQNAFLTGAGNNLQIGTAATGGTIILPGGETYGGTTSIINGTVSIAAASSLGTSTTAINLGSGANNVGINYAGAGETIARGLNFAGTTGTITLSNSSATGSVIYSGPTTFAASGAKSIILGNATDSFGGSIGAITNSGTGTTTLTKNGLTNSVWTLTGGAANTYTGATTINGGVLQTTNASDLANSYINLNGTNNQTTHAVLQTQGTIARTLSTAAAAGNLDWSSFSGFAAYGGVLNLNFNGGAQLVWGANGFMGSGTQPMVLGSTTANNQVVLSNAINLATTDSFTVVIYVEKGTGGDSALLSGVLSNGAGTSAASGISKQGAGTLILSGQSTYSGQTVVAQGTLVAGANSSAAGASSTGAFGSGFGPSTNTSPSYATINLGDSVNGVVGNAFNPTLLIGGAFTVARPVTVNDLGTNNVYAIGGSTDASSTLSGLVTFTNSGGKGNSFNVTQVATTGTDAFNVTGGITGSGTVTFANTGAVNVNSVVANTSATAKAYVVQSGAGTTTMSGINTYTGSTMVAGGKLNITGSTVAGSAFTVGNNSATSAILSGTGTVGGTVTTATTGTNVAYLAPGVNTSGSRGDFGSAGTLTVGNTLTMGDGTNLDIDLATGTTIGGGVNDLISLTGTGATLNFGSTGTLVVNYSLLGSTLATAPGSYYTLINGATTVNNFNAADITSTGLTGYTATYTMSGGALDVSFASNVATPSTVAYFNGSSSNLNQAGSYNTGLSTGTVTTSAPSPATNLFFSTSSNTSVTTGTVTSALEVNSVNFGQGGTTSTFTVAGTSTLTIDATNANGNTAGSGITIAAGGGSATISAPVALGNDQTWTPTSAGSVLTVSGQVSGAHALTTAGAGTVVLSNATGNTYSGGTTVSSGTLLADGGTITRNASNIVTATSGSATGSGAVEVKSGATLGGSGVIGGNLKLDNGAKYLSSDVQTGPNATPGMVVQNLDASAGNVTLTFYLGNSAANATPDDFAHPVTTASSFVTVLGTTAGEIAFNSSDTINLVDLSPGSLKLYMGTTYLLMTAGNGTELANDLYSGLTTSGGFDSNGNLLNGYVTNLNLSGSAFTDTPNVELYLYNGELEVVPEPSTWAMMLGGLAVLVFWQRRRSKQS